MCNFRTLQTRDTSSNCGAPSNLPFVCRLPTSSYSVLPRLSESLVVLTAVSVSKSANRNGNYNATRKEIKKKKRSRLNPGPNVCLFPLLSVILTRLLNEVWKQSYIYPLVRDNSKDLSDVYNLAFCWRLMACKVVQKLMKVDRNVTFGLHAVQGT